MDDVESIVFGPRELGNGATFVEVQQIQFGKAYYHLGFVDADSFIPVMETYIFIGLNLADDDSQRAYFQDADSFSRGVRYGSPGCSDEALFVAQAFDQLEGFCEFENALDILLKCSLRRDTPKVYRTRVLRSGKSIRVKGASYQLRRPPGVGAKTATLEYVTDIDFENGEKLGEEAKEVWRTFRDEADREQFAVAAVEAHHEPADVGILTEPPVRFEFEKRGAKWELRPCDISQYGSAWS